MDNCKEHLDLSKQIGNNHVFVILQSLEGSRNEPKRDHKMKEWREKISRCRWRIVKASTTYNQDNELLSCVLGTGSPQLTSCTASSDSLDAYSTECRMQMRIETLPQWSVRVCRHGATSEHSVMSEQVHLFMCDSVKRASDWCDKNVEVWSIFGCQLVLQVCA